MATLTPTLQAPRPGETWLLLDSRGRGGIESHVLVLAGALRDHGLPVRVVFLAGYGAHPLAPALAAAGVPSSTLAGGWRGLLAALRAAPPAQVHTHGYKAGLLGRTACRLLGVPVVSTFHSGDPGRGRVRLYDWLDRTSAPLAPALAVSDAIAARVRGPVRRVENFVTPPAAPPRGAGTTVAFVGRLSHEKGPDLFCALATALPGVAFEIFGDGPLRAGLERAHGDRVRFHGAVDDLARRWPGIGLLAMPSRHEGLPMAALEALAHGVPVAAFAVGGLPDLLRAVENGWCVPAGDLAALATALGRWRALDGAARLRLARDARASVTARFSPQAQLPLILAAYAESVRRTGRAASPLAAA
ncbi:MAG TPA: glycosyltransferase family 4 protein [Gammaproteobacteria bacterium]